MSTDFFEDYATEPVPSSIKFSGVRIGLLNGAMAFSVPGLVTGLEIGGAIPLSQSIAAFLLGGFLLAALGSVTGIVGQMNRLTTCMTITCVFGRVGAAVINFLVALSLLGWYGVQMDLFSEVVCQFFESWLNWRPNPLLVEIHGGIAMTITTVFGFKLMNRLSFWLVPIMILVMCYMAFKVSGVQALPPGNQTADVSFGDSVSIVIGSFIVGVVLLPDFTRFAGTKKDAVGSSFIAFFFLATLVYVVSALAAVRISSVDAIEVLLAIGMGSSALLLILISAWLTNVINLYGAGLGINAIFPLLKEHQIVIVAGVLGTIAASLNILDQFTNFLFGLAIVFAPIGGVYVTDFFLCRKKRVYKLDEFDKLPLVRWDAVFAWLAGIAVSLISQYGGLTLFNLEALEATATSVLAYFLLNKFWLAEGVSIADA